MYLPSVMCTCQRNGKKSSWEARKSRTDSYPDSQSLLPLPISQSLPQAKLKELAEKSLGSDILVVHFSGHGTQVPDESSEEKDGKVRRE